MMMFSQSVSPGLVGVASLRRLVVLGVAAACAIFLMSASLARAQSGQTVRFVVAFAPGGGVDVVARMIGDRVAASTGQTVIVENRPGAAGVIAARQVVAAEPNGKTILVASNPLLINEILRPGGNFHIDDELSPVAGVAPQAIVLVASPELQVSSLKELLDVAAKQPLNYATTGTGSLSHLAVEYLLAQTGSRMQHVPFTGAGPALTAVVANQVHIGSATVPPAVPLVTAGKVKALATAGEKRAALLPEVPTFGEAGAKPLPVAAWVGFFVSKKTPQAATDSISAAIIAAAGEPEVRKKLSELGYEDRTTDAAQFARDIAIERAIWDDVAKKANLIGTAN
jgi:tripartite-type tricarboxylate transporter receptor subunit TctC